MHQTERLIASVREDRRADYLFDTKSASEAVGCVPNKFGDWWFRTRGKLLELFKAQPGETAAELMAICAEGTGELEDHREGAKTRRGER